MVKLKKYSLILGVLLLIGCSSTPTIIEKPYPVYFPGSHHTIELVQDTVNSPIDSNAYWEGGVTDSLKKKIGWLKVYYNRKIAELKLHPRTDTIIVRDTVYQKGDKEIVETMIGLLPWWGEAVIILITIVLLYLNKNTILINLMKVFKK